MKKDMIKKGLLRDDGGDYLTWSHENGHLGHAEILVQYIQNPEMIKAIAEFQPEAMKIALDSRYGVPHRIGGGLHDVFGPHASNYHLWLRKIKQAFDPDEVSEPSGYISGKAV